MVGLLPELIAQVAKTQAALTTAAVEMQALATLLLKFVPKDDPRYKK